MEVGRIGGLRIRGWQHCAPPVGRRSAVLICRTKKPFHEGKTEGLLCLPLVGSQSRSWHEQKNPLTRAGLLMEVARDSGAIARASLVRTRAPLGSPGKRGRASANSSLECPRF